ncbi:MAG TPA: hypothetical protein VNU01_00885 [Egibacteraceae bacterium]|nr:hypothetical protein [Egibacteraceae bacterium]
MSAGTGKVVVAYLHPGEVSHSFMQSMMKLWLYEQPKGRILTATAQECGSARIIEGRNDAVRTFLRTEAEWLLFIDADMGFAPYALEQLLEVADPDERPIVGALCFGQRKGPETGAHARHFRAVPTLYQWSESPGQAGFAPMYGYRDLFPANAVVKVDGTGSAFILIHRRVFETIRDATTPEGAPAFPAPREWYADTLYKGSIIGEDLTFCLRAQQFGFPVYVHTGVKTSHYKHVYLDESTVGDLTDAPNFVVIPTKGEGPVYDLCRTLADQGEAAGIFVMDNGMPESKRKLVEGVPGVEVVDAKGRNIHQMWNAGLAEARARAFPANVAVLNDDIKVGPAFLSGLARPLRTHQMLAAVCPNYDGRDLKPDQATAVADICAGRYDGTGGLAGFAFMLKAEDGYRFPEELQWWWGDNDLLLSIHAAGMEAAIVGSATCEHIDGGGKTGKWDAPEMQTVLAADRAAFEAKWRPALEAA